MNEVVLKRKPPPPRVANLKDINSKASWFCSCGAHGQKQTFVEAQTQAGEHQCQLTFPRKKIRINVSEVKS